MLYKDSIKSYLADLKRIEMVSSEEEADIAQKLIRLKKLVGDNYRSIDRSLYSDEDQPIIEEGLQAYTRYVEANLRLVVSVAKRYQKQGFDLITIIQLGNLGLLRAVEKFDFTRGNKFSTYGCWWIRQGIARGITNTGRMIRLPIHISDNLDKINRTIKILTQELKRKPTVDEIATRANLTSSEVQFCLDSDRAMVSLNFPLNSEEDSELLDLIPDTSEDENPLRDTIENCLSLLSSLERKIIELKFGFSGKEQSWKQISRSLGCDKETLDLIYDSAIKKIKREYPSLKNFWSEA